MTRVVKGDKIILRQDTGIIKEGSIVEVLDVEVDWRDFEESYLINKRPKIWVNERFVDTVDEVNKKTQGDNLVIVTKDELRDYKRAEELLRVCKVMLEKAEDSDRVLDVLNEVYRYDNTKCDGVCLLNDITDALNNIG